MYKIIGADQKEYGPITADQIRQWISEGRVNGQTQACAEGTQDWKPLAMFPEFGFTSGPVAGSGPAADAGTPITTEEILARDYSLDIGRCFSRGWELFKNNFATLFVTFLLFLVLTIAAGGAAQLIFKIVGVNRLPATSQVYLSPINIIISALVVGPALGGLYHVYLSAIRGQEANIGDLFIGFKTNFQDLFLGQLVTSLIISVCTLPFTIVNTAKMAPLLDRIQQNPGSVKGPELFSQIFSTFASSLPVLVICMIPVTYISVNWAFTLALIIDKQMGFWTAMKTSWKIVHRHWFHVFGLMVVFGLLYLAGGLTCCIGVLITMPIATAALMYAYEDIFGRKKA
jgi:hypothetical protein